METFKRFTVLEIPYMPEGKEAGWVRAVDLDTDRVIGLLPYNDFVGTLYSVGSRQYVKISNTVIGDKPVVCLREFDPEAKCAVDLIDDGTEPSPFEHKRPQIRASKRIKAVFYRRDSAQKN
jgi:hypothetical protein